MRFFGNILSWAFAVVVAYVFASIFSTQMVLARLSGMGAEVTMAMRWETTVGDLVGLWQYALAIAVAFAIGFFVASLVKALLPMLAKIAYPTAGATSIAVALGIMFVIYGIVPIGGGQTTPGFILQMLAGAIGGVVFELSRPKLKAERR